MARKPDGSVVKPIGPVVPGGPAKPAVSPGNTRPNIPAGPPSPLLPGVPEFLVKDAKPADEVFNDEDSGYLGVDPIYRNAASATERPITEGGGEPDPEPEPEPEPDPEPDEGGTGSGGD